MVTRYLKKWVGLARSAHPARLYLPHTNGGLNLPLPSTLYQKLQVGKASLLITSRDAGVNHAVRESLKKEQKQKRSKFQPNTIVQQAFAADPGAYQKAVSRAAKNLVEDNIQSERMKHSLSLEVQGKLFKIIHQDAAAIWARTSRSLPSALMKFALNAASDTLPYNVNLSLWRKNDNLSAACKLCGERQTLCHILNNCKMALNRRRYDNRHDEILRIISSFVQKQVPDDVTRDVMYLLSLLYILVCICFFAIPTSLQFFILVMHYFFMLLAINATELFLNTGFLNYIQ